MGSCMAVHRSMTHRASALAMALALFAGTVGAEVTGGGTASSSVNVDGNTEVINDASAQSGGNVFDFSSSGGRNAPPAPSMGAFGGGSCVGQGTAVSGSAPGFSVGYGRSFEDDACQRRNWVQTIIGSAQHMPEAEAQALKRVALEMMMQDEYAGPAFEALGYESAAKRNEREAAARKEAEAANASRRSPREPEQRLGRMAEACTVVVPAGAPAAMKTLLSNQSCRVVQ